MTVAYTDTSTNELHLFPQRFRAAEELLARGYPAESWALLRQNLNDSAAALRKARAVDPRLILELDALLEQARRLAPSTIPTSYTREHAAWHERARRVSVHLAKVTGTRGDGRRSRRKLAATLLGLVLVCAALGVWFVFARRLKAHSSADYSPDFPARNAVDGLAATEWLLPGRSLGHLDIVLPRRRPVQGVVITNSHNRHYMDRATKRARVIVFDDALEVDSGEIRFTAIQSDPLPRSIRLRGKAGTRVRIDVLEYLGAGAGIAEVNVE